MISRFLLRHTLPRRLSTLAALLCCVPLAALLIPVLRLIGALTGLRPGGRGRTARLAAFAGTYLTTELTGLWSVLWLWASAGRAGRGPRNRAQFEDAHYALLQRLLGRLYRAAQRRFALRVVPPIGGGELPHEPVIVASRHAGPGDSFLLVYALLQVAQRRPRVVLSRKLTLDPLIDILLHRTPNCFIDPEQGGLHRAADDIAAITRGLGPQDALIIFPEGRNFTTSRRRRLIERLRRRRDGDLLPTARTLEHVLPPHGAGLFAAIDAAPPDTQVVFFAHAGLDRIETARDAWAAIPLTRSLESAWWAIPLTATPEHARDREEWLRRQWLRMDTWIDQHSPGSKGRTPSSIHLPRDGAPGIDVGKEPNHG